MITAVFSVIISVLPISNLAILPAIVALIFTALAFYISKKTGEVKKIIQFIFLLTILALSLSAYKAIFTSTEVTNTNELKNKEKESKEKAIEELEELELDDINLE